MAMQGRSYKYGLWHLSWIKEGSDGIGQWWTVGRGTVNGQKVQGVNSLLVWGC